MKALMIALALAPLGATVAAAGPIGSACNNSSRNGANPQICACIQQVADRTLDHADQRRAAGFFRDPQRAQDVRMSTTDSDNSFWQRYTSFGQAAASICAG
ncbi:hypothetical protein FGG78_39500 [Thioclava sp. BHET1]|nr:hypothetical protein FGG78_39500 [Thioclava sp. BHET1]